MRERAVVVNTTPLIALVAGTGTLDSLRTLYDRVIVPLEVISELEAGGPLGLGATEFAKAASWIERRTSAVPISEYLRHTLDPGEAAVIQTAVNEHIPRVCIDEIVGRRIARLSGLTVTGSLGILIKAKRTGHLVNLPDAIARMRQHGIWLSAELIRAALDADEKA